LPSVESPHRVRSSLPERLIRGVCGRLIKTLIQVPVDVQWGLHRSLTDLSWITFGWVPSPISTAA